MELRDFVRCVEKCAYVASRQMEKSPEEIRKLILRDSQSSGLLVSTEFSGQLILDFIFEVVSVIDFEEELKELWITRGRDAWDRHRYIEDMSKMPSEAAVHPGSAVIDRTVPEVTL